MEAIEIESDFSEIDDDTDMLVQDYLNDTRVESVVQAKRNNHDLPFTSEQLQDIALYKSAIALNRETEAAYKKLEDSLVRMLVDVRNKLKENEAALMKQSNSSNEGFNYLRCGKPYFKDKNNFPAPENEDTIMMKQAQMFDFSQVTSVPGWTVRDKTEFVNALLEKSRDIKKKELRSQISRLRRDKKNLMEIAKLEREVNQLNKKTLTEIALPLDQEYDWEDLANSLNRRHTEQEYQALWKLFFHPSINKSSWSKTEHQELQRIASAHNKQDWDNIAKQLNTGRTGYQCFVYYRTNMTDSASTRKWTNEEMEYLQRVVEYFKEGTYIPWGKVASAMDGRTKIQVYNKYMRMIERRKGRFLEEEDIVLLNCYDKYGGDFRKISEFLPGRSAVQLKTRFHLLTKFRLSTTWSVQDDKKLVQIMANLDSFSYSSATKHFPGKDRINIRSRYVTLMKWMKAHPTSDICMAPRRGARRLLHGHAAVNLKDAIANLNKRIETEVNTKKKKKITIQSREEEIEDGIMAALINEIIKEEGTKKPDLSDPGEDTSPSFLPDASSENTDNMRNLLIFLNAAMDKEKFENSKYALKYPGLSDTSPKELLRKVKSYSKTNNVRTIEMENFPDIWGKKAKLKHAAYVLPPNYATITGCRVLMKCFGAKRDLKPEHEINLSLMQRKNMFIRQGIETLKERFTMLYMWPIMLSNELPNITDKPYVGQPRVERKSLPHPNGLTIPTPKKSYLNFQAKQRNNEVDDDEINEPDQSNCDLSKIQFSSRIPSSPGYSDEVFISDEDSHGS